MADISEEYQLLLIKLFYLLFFKTLFFATDGFIYLTLGLDIK